MSYSKPMKRRANKSKISSCPSCGEIGKKLDSKFSENHLCQTNLNKCRVIMF